MPSYQNINEIPAPDIAIIGGGIVGLWTAYYAAQSGVQVLLIDKGKLGGGASNGILGALMPHQPINWNDKKQFQLDGLTSLPGEIAKLQSLTGIECGYFQCGRIMPITNAEKRRQSEGWARSAADYWIKPFEWSVNDKNTAEGWMFGKGNHGYNTDTLSARINPRGLIDALITHLKTLPNLHIAENARVKSLIPDGGIIFSNDQKVRPGKTIVTAGFECFGLLKPLTKKALGWGVKGQAALLRPTVEIDVSAPIIYDNSTYVIVHENGLVAVGSTSEREYTDENSTDEKLDDVIAAAKAVCPILNDAKIVERWAGVRPRAAGRDPIIGALPDQPNIIVATGGFKITLAIAHIMARTALAAAAGHSATIPESFRVEAHL